MKPTLSLPSQLTSANAAFETLRPIQIFLYRFVQESVRVTKETAGVMWMYTQPVLQNISDTTTLYTLSAITTSIETIQRRGGEAYTVVNEAIVEFVEADIEQSEQVNMLNRIPTSPLSMDGKIDRNSNSSDNNVTYPPPSSFINISNGTAVIKTSSDGNGVSEEYVKSSDKNSPIGAVKTYINDTDKIIL